jgi:predicted CXXCH cytochrome family protein
MSAAMGCGSRQKAVGPTAVAPGSPKGPRSNVTRGDYAGSAACRPCHPAVVAAWERSPMHRMTRDALAADIRAPFDGTRFRFKGDTVVLEQHGPNRFMRVEPALGDAQTYRVTRVIGGRTREDFAGVNVRGGDEELVLPVSYVFATRALRYKGYSVMVHERDGLRAGPVWSRTCIFCHNTVPEMDRLLGAIAGPHSQAYQGEQVDPWLAEDRREHVRITDDAAFARDVGSEMVLLGGASPPAFAAPRRIARAAIDVVAQGFDGRALVEVGIGCEACHGGARQHASDPSVGTSFVPSAPWLDVALPSGNSAQAVNRVCARCHQVLFSRYPFTWEGGRRDASAGGSHINSGEGRDFLLGACSGEMACSTCHDPHGGGAENARLAVRRLATVAGNAVCTTCHTALAEPERRRAHAHHDPNGAGGACVACHMPRKNMGLDGVLTRYHRIGSPTDADRVLGDRPLECALCHADRSVAALINAMEVWWKVRYPRQRLQELYGSLDANVMRATLERGKPHEQAVAIAVLGEAGARDAVPLVARSLLSEYPLVREWAKRSLVSILGRCDVDLGSDDATIAKQARTCGGTALVPPGAATSSDEPED